MCVLALRAAGLLALPWGCDVPWTCDPAWCELATSACVRERARGLRCVGGCVCAQPRDIALSGIGGYAYVTGASSDSMAVIDVRAFIAAAPSIVTSVSSSTHMNRVCAHTARCWLAGSPVGLRRASDMRPSLARACGLCWSA